MSLVIHEPFPLPLVERVRQNFTTHKWQIVCPGPAGLAALVGTIVFFVSNPFGWAFSAGIVGTTIALAGLSAIGAIGYSLYYLLKNSRVNNSLTYEWVKEPKKTPEPAPPPKRLPAAPKPPKKKKPKPVAFQKELPPRRPPIAFDPPVQRAPIEPSSFDMPPPEAPGLKQRIKDVASWMWENRVGSALVLGSLLLGGYGLYSHLAQAAPLAPTNPLASTITKQRSAQLGKILDHCPKPRFSSTPLAKAYKFAATTCPLRTPTPPPPPVQGPDLYDLAQSALNIFLGVLVLFQGHNFS
ncbi:MAG TPA: hypothetical protein VLF94_06055 [Chlamydiales bacterium]|nr:hypothetical protein [Chlamydiales bacterium]